MKNLNLVLLTLFGSTTFSCTMLDDNLLEKAPATESCQDQADTRFGSHDKYRGLGFSYDFTDEYLKWETKGNILDLEKLYEDHPDWIQVERLPQTAKFDVEIHTGRNYREFVQDAMEKSGFNANIASLTEYETTHPEYAAPYFRLENLKPYFKENDRLLSNESYCSVNLSKHYESVLIDKTPELLYDYVSDVFKMEANNFEPDKIIEKFGTHVLLSIKSGARIHMDTRSEITDYYDEAEKNDIVLSRLIEWTGMPHEMFETGLSEEQVKKNAGKNNGGSINLYHIGSQCSGWKSEQQPDGRYKSYFNLREWQASIDPQLRGITGIDFSRAYPIYDFIEDPVKREAVKAALEQHLASKEKPILNVKPMHQLKSKRNGDTWWVYSKEEVDQAVNRWGDRYDGVVAFVLTEPSKEAYRPLHTLKSAKGDTWHAYTWEDVVSAQETFGDEYLGVGGYVYDKQQPHTAPMFRLKSRKTGDTWYAFSEYDAYYAMREWKDEMTGPEGYVYLPKY